MIAAKGWDETQEQFEAGTLKVSTWAAAKAAPKGARVAGFVILWAMAMRAEGRDSYTITEYQRYWNEGRAAGVQAAGGVSGVVAGVRDA